LPFLGFQGAKPLAAREAGGKNGWFMAQELKVIQDFYDFILWLVW
jgi:hypothetical protein